MGANSNGCLNTAFYLVEISPCTGISEGRFSQSQVNVYPNPNSGSFKVSAGSDVVLIMRNQLGQHIRTLVLNNANGYRATVQDLSAGLYFLSDEKNTRPAFKIVVN
ncbi:MAG: T9SS C-terminal target domain-containing protein [Sphingobacteriia bacterium]|nr:T9SS C-terminal target domain-containing protein [Sphingobacteriia bacterium]